MIGSDSDDDDELFSNNVFNNEKDSTVISVKGPNINVSNVTGISFRSNILSSTLQVPRNVPRYAQSSCYQQNMYSRRETSPMSAYNYRQRDNSYRKQTMSSYNPVNNQRSDSAMSMRSFDSNASHISAANIKMAIKSKAYSMQDVRIIVREGLLFMKQNSRKKIMKRMKLRRFLKGGRLSVSGGDSGEQGSNSSISSDESSTKTSNIKKPMSIRSIANTGITDISNLYKDCTDNLRQNSLKNRIGFNNTPMSRSLHKNRRAGSSISSHRSVAMLPNFKNAENSLEMPQRKRFQNGLELPSNRYNHNTACTSKSMDINYGGRLQNERNPRGIHEMDSDQEEMFSRIAQQNTMINNLRNVSSRSMVDGSFNFNNKHASTSSQSMVAGSNLTSFVSSNKKGANITAMPQKDRFNNGYLLPSQRFNRSLVSTTIPELAEYNNYQDKNNVQIDKGFENPETDSDEIIFGVSTKKSVNNAKKKRNIDNNDDIQLLSQKKAKTASPRKPKDNTKNDEETDGFVFAKPTFPVRKSAKEKVISKSSSLSSKIEELQPVTIKNSQPRSSIEPDKEQDLINSLQDTTDVLMRPSFIKRKLFTQKLDVSEKKNTSTDSSNSPQNSIYGAIQKERTKARKLQQVTSQSCLNREIPDESNLLDLIHKIVPQDQINVTIQTNKTDIQNSKNRTDDSEKWDVTSIIAETNNGDGSDTYTDEEIFNATLKQLSKENVNQTKKKQKKVKTPKQNTAKKPSPQKPIIEKICYPVVERINLNHIKQNSTEVDVPTRKNSVQKCIKSFWDIDFESDAECQQASPNDGSKLNENLRKEDHTVPKFQGYAAKFNSSKSSVNASLFRNKTTEVFQKFNTSTIRVRSHRTPKRKKLDQTTDKNETSVFLPVSKKLKASLNISSINLAKTDSKPQYENVNATENLCEKVQTKSVTSQKTDKHNKSIESIKESAFKKSDTNNKLKIDQTKPRKTLTKEKSKNEAVDKQSCQNKEICEPSLAPVETKKGTKKQSNNTKTKTATKKKIKTIKKSTESKAQNKNSKSNTKKTTKNDFSVNDTAEENSNISNISSRPIRSCRLSKNNSTLNSTTLHSLNNTNETANKTLRSRQIDLTPKVLGNVSKANQNITNKKDAKSKLSDVSFSLPVDRNVAKKAVINTTTSRSLRSKDVDSSDVSFSLSTIDSPVPNRTVSSRVGVSTRTCKSKHESTSSVQNGLLLMKDLTQCSTRNRIPNNKYLA